MVLPTACRESGQGWLAGQTTGRSRQNLPPRRSHGRCVCAAGRFRICAVPSARLRPGLEFLHDAARVHAISTLGSDLAPHLTRASARKVILEVIADYGVDAARSVVREGLEEAARRGKRRPTAAMLTARGRVP